MCGFHVAFIATHLPSFLVDNGVAQMIGATALSLIGLFNMIGSFLFGRLGDRFRKKRLLSLLYFSRAVVIGCFLIVPVTGATALVFAALIGFLWLATVPLTSGIVAQIFGTRHLSSLYGIVFLSHQVGGFLGVWLGGRIYRRHRLLQSGLDRRDHPGRRRGDRAPADQGPSPVRRGPAAGGAFHVIRVPRVR